LFGIPFRFLPHLSEIKWFVEKGDQKIQPIYQSIYPLAVAGETKEGIRTHAVRQAYWSLVHSKKKQGMGSWHLNNMLWYFASHIHLTDQEVFGLWVNCAGFECDKGLSEASKVYYDKLLSELSLQEQAGLVALLRSPSRYKVGSDKSKNRIREILKKAGAHNKANPADTKSRAVD
jgi:membrane carboxypeptidase/penicillin-binding protein PbpC